MARAFSLSELAMAMEKGNAELFIVLDGMKFKVAPLTDHGGMFGSRYFLYGERVVDPVPEPETVYVAESPEVEPEKPVGYWAKAKVKPEEVEPEEDEPVVHPAKKAYHKK